jgi:hypothetical protein
MNDSNDINSANTTCEVVFVKAGTSIPIETVTRHA